MSKSVILASCPFCGGRRMATFQVSDDDSGPGAEPWWRVECERKSCKAQGPRGTTQTAAMDAWDKAPRPFGSR